MEGESMPWPWGRKDFFDFDDEFDRIRKEMERMFEEAFKDPIKGEVKGYGPYIYGFSMNVGPDGKPIVREFGNVKPKLKGLRNEREPLVDVIEEKDRITVIVELPGISREDIRLNCTESNLSIKVDNPQRKYNTMIELPAKVRPNSAKANYKNGVLEINLQRTEQMKEGKRHGIKVS